MERFAEIVYGILPEMIQSATSVENIEYILSRIIVQLGLILVVLVAGVAVICFAKRISRRSAKLVRISAATVSLLLIACMVNWILLGPMSNLMSAAFVETRELREETSQSSRDLVTEIASEGIVMAKNTDNALPLESGANLNVFGWASTNPVYGGTGSGAVDVSRAVSLLDGIRAGGFNLNEDLINFYTEYEDTRPVADVMIGEAVDSAGTECLGIFPGAFTASQRFF